MATQLPPITVEADALDFWDVVYRDPNQKSACGDGSNLWLSPGYNGPTYLNNPFSTLFLNGLDTDSQCPGYTEVRITRQRAIDKKKPAGADVGTVTVHGINPAEFDIDVHIWTADQWYSFKRWLNLPRSKTTSKTVTTTTSTTTVIGTKSALFQSDQPQSGGRQPITQTIPQLPQTKTVSTTKQIPFLPKAGKNAPVPWNCYHAVLNAHGIGQLIIIGMTGPHPHSLVRSKVITLKCVEWATPATAKKDVTNTDTASHGNVLDPPPISAPGAAAQSNITQNQKSGATGNNKQNPSFYNAGSTTVPTPKAIS